MLVHKVAGGVGGVPIREAEHPVAVHQLARQIGVRAGDAAGAQNLEQPPHRRAHVNVQPPLVRRVNQRVGAH